MQVFVPRLLLGLALVSIGLAVRADYPFTGTQALVFDSQSKEYRTQPGEMSAPFTFYLTNISAADVTITSVKPSCGCTTVKMPATPWVLPPGASGFVEASVNLFGKMGTVTKTLTFNTSAGTRLASLKVVMPSPETAFEDRKAAMAVAASDPQAIFRGDCASCHADKGRAALGEALYVADCGICHESPRRESIVPDLHALRQPTSFEYWKNIIAFGKPHSLMPPFAMAQGGPLTDQQVLSLAGYLSHVIAPLAPMTSAAHP